MYENRYPMYRNPHFYGLWPIFHKDKPFTTALTATWHAMASHVDPSQSAHVSRWLTIDPS